jgi:hypothetical protein
MMDRQNSNIQITGVKETARALKEFAPDLHKSMNKEIRKSLNVVKARAQSKYPKGSWKININQKRILGSIVATSGGGTSTGSSWSNAPDGVRAAIFEFAGSKTDGATPQAKGLIKSLNARYGTPGRFLWSAWDETGKQALSEIETAVRRAERDLQGRLDAIGEEF